MIIGCLDIDPLSSMKCFSLRARSAFWTPCYVIWIPMHVSTNVLIHMLIEKIKRGSISALIRVLRSHRDNHRPLYLSDAPFNAPVSVNSHTSSVHYKSANFSDPADKRVNVNMESWREGKWSLDCEPDGMWMRKVKKGTQKVASTCFWLITKDTNRCGSARLWHKCQCDYMLLYVMEAYTQYEGGGGCGEGECVAKIEVKDKKRLNLL